jgi:predicted phosphoribosyltransferase
MTLLRDRREAGHRLAQKLQAYRDRDDVLVLALPRGGVPVAFELAQELNLPMDVFLVRKLGVPWQPELAMGAVASGGVRVLNPEVVHSLHMTDTEIEDVARREEQILRERERLFRGDRPPPRIEGKTVILVDDGLATGSSMRAAIEALRRQNPARIVVAVPVSSSGTCEELGQEVDEIVCLATPEPFYAVGQWYVDFSPTSDEEVQELLAAPSSKPTAARHSTFARPAGR